MKKSMLTKKQSFMDGQFAAVTPFKSSHDERLNFCQKEFKGECHQTVTIKTFNEQTLASA